MAYINNNNNDYIAAYRYYLGTHVSEDIPGSNMREPVSSIYIWSENASPKSKAKDHRSYFMN
jgi:hypothetical protein